ncbi:hypothetical protein [Acinetobacter populi]|uniref:Uncharacterized protein n=1 Tax=Acinetobacter populi TaxID=1582270 RepID=A0A1Z9Z262_9GAMM|nr:hypothetical protein [Acinetobacter populi]OUY08545.1 hypothetical protein CAP51_02715 [Acinetobacter populi]
MINFNAVEKHEASNQLNIVTGVNQSTNYSLFSFLELTKKLETGKRNKIFTNNLTAFPHPSIPNLYFTNLGYKILMIASNNLQNPYTTGKFQNTLIHPKVALLSQLMFKHSLHNFNIEAHQRIEHACETCFADFKVHIQTRAFITQATSWINRYRSCSNAYDRFLEFIYQESNKFEIHSLIVQRKRPNGFEPFFGDPNFCDMSAYEIVREKCDEIIQNVWRNRHKNDVLGILSREEIDIEQTCSIRLIFFVRKKFSDLISFADTNLYETLESYFIDHNLDHICLGSIYTINSGIAPLFQEQEQNYYDLNQMHVGNRLNVLRAQLVIPNYLFRIRDDSCSLIIERGRGHYER